MFSKLQASALKNVCKASAWRALSYTAPVKDVKFVLDEVLKVQNVFPEEHSTDVVDAVIDEIAKFTEKELFPIWKNGDAGCKYDAGEVTIPEGWKAAYEQYVAGGWPTLVAEEKYGGQNFPFTVDTVKTEFCGTANWTWFMYPMLSHGAVECMIEWADDAMKEKFLPKLISGEWTGTMCLTESHAGSDLSDLRTKAIPVGDGSYKITGQKIFISCGECDISGNIIHLVLARLPDAPKGTKGISLFLVPKWLEKADGTLDTTKKNVFCTGIEHKMGIKGSATAVLSFDDSIGWLIGQPHDGMKQMFAFMNTARLAVGVQGLGTGELSYQGALAYARERPSGRAPGKPVTPEKPADAIIHHPEVSRMLYKMKSFAEGARCLVYHTSLLMDEMRYTKDAAAKKKASGELAFLTPIVKAFLTELSLEIANDGIQVYGGHGYVNEWGMEQILRDARISTLYEGTTGIQSLDLLGRKVMMDRLVSVTAFTNDIQSFCKECMSHEKLAPKAKEISTLAAQWLELSGELAMKASKDPAVVEAAAVDYMWYSGYVTLGYMWLRMETVAQKALDAGTGDAAFYKSKIATSDYYFARLLPRTKGYAATMLAPPSVLAGLPEHSAAMEA